MSKTYKIEIYKSTLEILSGFSALSVPNFRVPKHLYNPNLKAQVPTRYAKSPTVITNSVFGYAANGIPPAAPTILLGLKPSIHRWFAGREYTLEYQMHIPGSGFRALSNPGSIIPRARYYLEVPSRDDALLFKLTWGGR